MRLGIDCDGVLCDFSGRYADIVNEMFDVDVDIAHQRDWSFESVGVNHQMDDAIWEKIKDTEDFWKKLDPLAGADNLFWLQKKHDLFFITSRVPTKGDTVARQTARWLSCHHEIEYPTVLVADQPSQKIPLALDLGLDAFVDDKSSTVKSMRNAGLNAYIFDQPYNQDVAEPRVKTVDEFLERVACKN